MVTMVIWISKIGIDWNKDDQVLIFALFFMWTRAARPRLPLHSVVVHEYAYQKGPGTEDRTSAKVRISRDIVRSCDASIPTIPNRTPGKTVLPTQANSSQGFQNLVQVGYRGSSWIELTWIWSGSNFRPTRSRFSTVCPPWQPRANSHQVVSLLLGDYAVVVRQLNGFLWAGSTWRYRLATRRSKFWFCNLARVGLSWEYRLARTSDCI